MRKFLFLYSVCGIDMGFFELLFHTPLQHFLWVSRTCTIFLPLWLHGCKLASSTSIQCVFQAASCTDFSNKLSAGLQVMTASISSCFVSKGPHIAIFEMQFDELAENKFGFIFATEFGILVHHPHNHTPSQEPSFCLCSCFFRSKVSFEVSRNKLSCAQWNPGVQDFKVLLNVPRTGIGWDEVFKTYRICDFSRSTSELPSHSRSYEMLHF